MLYQCFNISFCCQQRHILLCQTAWMTCARYITGPVCPWVQLLCSSTRRRVMSADVMVMVFTFTFSVAGNHNLVIVPLLHFLRKVDRIHAVIISVVLDVGRSVGSPEGFLFDNSKTRSNSWQSEVDPYR